MSDSAEALPSDIALADHLANVGPLFVVLDAAQGESMLPSFVASSTSVTCLYDGPEATLLSDIAPYVILISPQVSSLSSLLALLREHDGGFIATSGSPLPELRRHLRRFLRARSPTDGVVLFRFYDPRVLAAFYDASTDYERALLLTPFEQVFVPVDRAEWRPLRGERGLVVQSQEAPTATRPFELRPVHLDAFAAVAFSSFIRRTSEVLRQIHVDRLREVDEATLRGWLEGELPRARGYGLRTERDIVGWCLLRLGYGEGLEQERPWLVDVMRDVEVSGAEKLRRVRRGLHLERQRGVQGA